MFKKLPADCVEELHEKVSVTGSLDPQLKNPSKEPRLIFSKSPLG
jgi:hypothetical protein